MNTDFPYKLKPYKTGSDRETCPSCGSKRQFARYIEIATGELLPEKYGWCNRRDSCGYHLNPMKDGYKTDREGSAIPAMPPPSKPNVIVDIPADILIDSLNWNEENTLYKYLISILPAKKVKSLFDEYLVGNHSVWPGAVIFWFVNIIGAIRAGQVKQFDKTGHTVKAANKEGEIKSRTIWVHNLIPQDRYEWMQAYRDQDLRQDCLFGEHLLKKYPHKPVAMFESQKTAIMAAAFFPKYLCMAFGSLDNFTYERSKVLKGRKVLLYPDLSKNGSAFAKWQEKAERFKSITEFKISTILEDNATDEERIKGLDMADFLEKFTYADESAKPKTQKIVLTDNQSIGFPTRCNVTPTAEKSAAKTMTAEFSALQNKKAKNPAVLKEETEDLINELIPETAKNKFFDTAEYRAWLKTVEIPIGHVLLNNQVPIYHLPNFIAGRLNHIDAFTNYGYSDKKNLYIRQLKYIQRHYHTLINQINENTHSA